MEKISPQQFWKLYQKIPRELQITLLSEETADSISNICQKNEIKEEMETKIAEYVGYILLGVLPSADFQKVLEKEVKLKKNVAEKISYEIARFIFSPIKDSLATLYSEKGVKSPEKIQKPAVVATPIESSIGSEKLTKEGFETSLETPLPEIKKSSAPETSEKAEKVKEPPKKEAKKPDIYHEPLE